MSSCAPFAMSSQVAYCSWPSWVLSCRCFFAKTTFAESHDGRFLSQPTASYTIPRGTILIVRYKACSFSVRIRGAARVHSAGAPKLTSA